MREAWLKRKMGRVDLLNISSWTRAILICKVNIRCNTCNYFALSSTPFRLLAVSAWCNNENKQQCLFSYTQFLLFSTGNDIKWLGNLQGCRQKKDWTVTTPCCSGLGCPHSPLRSIGDLFNSSLSGWMSSCKISVSLSVMRLLHSAPIVPCAFPTPPTRLSDQFLLYYCAVLTQSMPTKSNQRLRHLKCGCMIIWRSWELARIERPEIYHTIKDSAGFVASVFFFHLKALSVTIPRYLYAMSPPVQPLLPCCHVGNWGRWNRVRPKNRIPFFLVLSTLSSSKEADYTHCHFGKLWLMCLQQEPSKHLIWNGPQCQRWYFLLKQLLIISNAWSRFWKLNEQTQIKAWNQQ